MTDQDKILQFLRMNGPALPSKIGKLLNTDLLLASAHLSDLAAQGKVKVSSLKIGGSPLYYLPGQEQQLYTHASGNLNPKDFQVLNSLRENKLLQEKRLPLLDKVALRSLKDFAVPLQVTLDGQKELFWKWHLCTAPELETLFQHYFEPAEEKEKAETRAAEPLQQTLTERKESATENPELERAPSPVKKPGAKRKKQEEEFFPLVEDSFRKLKISVEQKETIRKNAEFNLILKVPSAVGAMTYFCKAKNKSKCDEKDLSAAYMQAQIKKLPLLLLYTGELSKKAQEMLESGAFENVMVRKVE